LAAGQEIITPEPDADIEDVGPAAMSEPQAQGAASASPSAVQASGSVQAGGITASGSAKLGPSGASASGSVSLGGGGGGSLGNNFKSGSTPRDGDPDVSYAFKVTIDGKHSGMFNEAGGLSWKAESIPIRSGGNNEHGFHMRGPGKFEPLTLKRGFFAANDDFFNMLKNSLSAKPNKGKPGFSRVNVTVAILNRKYETIGEYTLKNAFIIEYTGLQLNAGGSQVGFEQIRMAYDYFEYKGKGK